MTDGSAKNATFLPRWAKQILLVLASLAGGILMLFMVATGVGMYYLNSDAYQRYQTLKIGMSKDEVQVNLKGKPYHTYVLENATVEYYVFPSRMEAKYLKNDTFPAVDSIRDLPHKYDFFQLLYNDEGKLVAYTWNGETSEVVTSKGNFEGSMIQAVPSEIVDALLTPDER